MKISRVFIAVMIFIIPVFAGVKNIKSDNVISKKVNVAMIIAPSNFRDEELLVPLNIFKRAGFNVTVFSEKLGDIKGMLGTIFKPDKKLNELNVSRYDAIVFVGGSGASVYWNDPLCHKLCRQAIANNKILAAICISPVTLAKAGVLKGKKATVWQSVSRKIIKCGAKYTAKSVTVDGNIITANGPSAAKEFANTIINKIKK